MPETIRGEPRTESTGPLKRRTMFEMLEDPTPGWSTDSVKRLVSSESPVLWLVVLVRNADGEELKREASSLYVAWARATEAAHMMSNGI